jgi:STELLO glycosyltransferases
MADETCLVVTSVAEPTPALAGLAAGAAGRDISFILIGDAASPPQFSLDGCDFYSLERQQRLPFELASICPVGHYARKNIGYLCAMRSGARLVIETDDDSFPYTRFWTSRVRLQHAQAVGGQGWVNAYRYFSNDDIWPRGFPLDIVRAPASAESQPMDVDCPIQQGLVDDDPDVDAVYRMLFRLPFCFERGPAVALTAGSWCPFNSQNTSWWQDAFPLMYLPATCSFRMTDIWRSFVAQRLAWANGWGVLFHEATMRQARNKHDLAKDFADEVPGYLNNRMICAALESLEFAPGTEHLGANMRRAYELLVEREMLHEKELLYLDAWLADVASILTITPALIRQ